MILCHPWSMSLFQDFPHVSSKLAWIYLSKHSHFGLLTNLGGIFVMIMIDDEVERTKVPRNPTQNHTSLLIYLHAHKYHHQYSGASFLISNRS